MSRVVIVDDQAINRKVLSRLAGALEPDVEVVAFEDPISALSFVRQNTLDLLITDYKMPQISGAEMIRRFRTFPSCCDVPALVVTAYEDMEYRARAMEAGANDFILSPLNHTEFRLQSRKLLALRRETLAGLFNFPKPEGEIIQGSTKARSGQIEMFNGLLEHVSAKLLHKSIELRRANADLQILLESNATPTIFVDKDLQVRRYTSQIATIYNLKTIKIGASLAVVDCKLKYNELLSDFREVVRSGQAIERYLEAQAGGMRYVLRMIPNYYGDNSPSGAILIFNDVTAWSSVRPGGRAVH
jgi:CheY-like chemotaxis protein